MNSYINAQHFIMTSAHFSHDFSDWIQWIILLPFPSNSPMLTPVSSVNYRLLHTPGVTNNRYAGKENDRINSIKKAKHQGHDIERLKGTTSFVVWRKQTYRWFYFLLFYCSECFSFYNFNLHTGFLWLSLSFHW